jgi:uncharacterized delta-60 repeat protein
MIKKLSILVVLVLVNVPALAQTVDTAWVRTYNGPADTTDEAWVMTLDNSGNIYVAGLSMGVGTGFDFTTVKYYPDGDTAWARRYNGPGDFNDAVQAITVDGSGNVFVTGGVFGAGTSWDAVTIKYHPNGDTAWVRTYNGPENDEDAAFALAVDGSGNVYVAGRTFSLATQDDFLLIKYYPNGDTAWVRRYNGPANSYDGAHTMVLDDDGNVYVAGHCDFFPPPAEQLCDFATIKYDSDGNQCWTTRYNGPGDDADWASAAVVDDSGNIYVTGPCWGGPTTQSDFATIKYNPEGDTIWVRLYHSAIDGADQPSALATDHAGNVYVTGIFGNFGKVCDYGTVKYSSGGDQVWTRNYNGTGNAADGAYDVAVDRFGSIYVTGISWGLGTNFDFATIKYYADGDTAWIKRYDGPARAYDHAHGLALDDSGNVYVTGISERLGTYNDFATVKYRQHNDPPDSFCLIFPPNKAFTPKKIHFKWENATDPNPGDETSYELHVSTSFGFHPDSTTIDTDLASCDHVKNLNYGKYFWKVKAKDRNGGETWCDQVHYFMVTGIAYTVGDFNGDGEVNSGDVVFGTNYLFRSGQPPEPLESGDVNCDQGVDAGDVVYLINYLFRNGEAPCT